MTHEGVVLANDLLDDQERGASAMGHEQVVELLCGQGDGRIGQGETDEASIEGGIQGEVEIARRMKRNLIVQQFIKEHFEEFRVCGEQLAFGVVFAEKG